MRVVRGNEATPERGETFTGDTQLRRLLGAQQPGGMAVSVVHFGDGSRTHWHVHPGEQVLYILEGQGRVGTADEEMQVGPGDLVYAAPGERHWHGAAPGQSMTHLSVTNVGPAEWFEAPDE
jgi:quercetin dioxygenase-like cupin family protein